MIDTKYERKKFIDKFIVKNQNNFLLDGKWGTGKTTFIKSVILDIDSYKYNVKYVSLWEINDSKNIYETIFGLLYKKGFPLLILLIICLVTLSSFFITNTLDLTISLLNSRISWFLIIIILSIIITILFTDNTFRNYSFKYLLIYSIKFKLVRKKIIIIDDIDRLDDEIQKYLFPIFDQLLLNTRAHYIFLGDSHRLTKVGYPFISKIISITFSIDTILTYQKVAEYIEKSFSDMIDSNLCNHKISESDKKYFYSIINPDGDFKLSIREVTALIENFKIYFLDLKCQKVNFGEFFIMLYLYSLKREVYDFIIKNHNVLISYSRRDFTPKVDIDEINIIESIDEIYSEFKDLIFLLFPKNKYYPAQNDFYYPSINNENNFRYYNVNFDGDIPVINEIAATIIKSSNDLNIELSNDVLESIKEIIPRREEFDLSVSELELFLLRFLSNYFQFGFSERTNGFLSISPYESILRFLKINIYEKSYDDPNVFIKNLYDYKKFDISDFCRILPIFIKESDLQLDSFKKLIELSENTVDIMNNNIKYFIFFYKHFYIDVKNENIDKSLNSILELSNQDFIDYVNKYLLLSFQTLGKLNKTLYLDIEAISYSKEFNDNFIKKVDSFEYKDKLYFETLIKAKEL